MVRSGSSMALRSRVAGLPASGLRRSATLFQRRLCRPAGILPFGSPALACPRGVRRPSRPRLEQLDGCPAAGGEVLAGALAAARRRPRGGDDVFDAVAGAGAAVVARRPPAVLHAGLGQRVLPVLPEEVLVQAGRHMSPREDLVP